VTKALDRSKEPSPGPIRDYEFPAVSSRSLPNGIRSLVCRAGGIPLITAHIIVDAGAASEPAAKSGVANMTANLLEGGTTTLGGTDLAWRLEELGLELTAWTTWDATHIRVTALTERIQPALELIADIVRNPAFPANEVERIRGEQLAEIMQRSTDPRALADDSAGRFIFTRDSTYSRTVHGSAHTVTGIDRADVIAFHQSRYQPNSVSVLLVGDVGAEPGHAWVAAAFGDWNGKAAAPAPFVGKPAAGKTAIHVIDRPGAVQSELRIGHVGVARTHPDYFPISVLNALLGGAFTSRLNLSLREKHGFTYGVRSAFAMRREPGPFVISTAVGTDVTGRAVEEAFREIRGLLDGGVTDTEVANARDYLAGVFPLQLQSTEELAARISEIVVYGLTDNYFHDYRKHILQVEREDVERCAKAFIHPDHMAVTVVGDAAALQADLEKSGAGDVIVESIAEPVDIPGNAGAHGG
jgi:zinc protease